MSRPVRMLEYSMVVDVEYFELRDRNVVVWWSTLYISALRDYIKIPDTYRSGMREYFPQGSVNSNLFCEMYISEINQCVYNSEGKLIYRVVLWPLCKCPLEYEL